MISQNKKELLKQAISLLHSIIDGNKINAEFESYLIDTAITIRYSGIIPALINNENKTEVSTIGFKPPLVNNILIKLLKEFYAYPGYLQFGTIKDICMDPYRETVLKAQILEIMGVLKEAIRTYNTDNEENPFNAKISEEKPEYKRLISENVFAAEEYHGSRVRPDLYGSTANLRLAYFSYYETDKGFQSWFNAFGINTVNANLNRKIMSNGFDETRFNYEKKCEMLPKPKGSQTFFFKLAVDKRGLLIGTGYPHFNITNSSDSSDFQLGMFFDWSTGIPIIPASSIKGFLLAAFRNENKDILVTERLIELCKKAGIEPNLISAATSKILADDTFGTSKQPVKGSMVFNAFITGRRKLKHDTEKSSYNNILDEDWLAPHIQDKKRSKFCEPVPIRFLKLAPGVEFCFGFMLKSTELKCSDGTKGLVTAEQKSKLFKEILLSRNLGAKHRTGFGKFVDCI